jgi:lysozyme
LNQLRGTKVTQAQFDALVSWSFNTGGPASSSVWPAVRRGDVEGVCERLARWNMGGGRVLRGLVRRRAAECALYRGKIDDALRIAGTRRDGRAMVQRVDDHGSANTRPTPPVSEVARRTRSAGAAAGAGAATAGAGTLAPSGPKNESAASADSPIGIGAVLLIAGALIVVVAGVVAWRRWRHLVREWA